ncbi:MAG: Hpt domain-containing protein [Hyphomicrobiales bacterium]
MKGPTDIGRQDGRRGASGKPEAAAPCAVVDTRHLECQVGGDLALRAELLELYAGRLVALAPAVCGPPSLRRREAAHALKGASLAVGAFPLARLCESLETQDGADARRGARSLIEATRRCVAELLRPRD